MGLERWSSKGLAALLVGVVVGVLASPPAGAHTDLDSSEPADGEVVDRPLEELLLVFTTTVIMAGEGVTVIDAAGTPVEVDEIVVEGREVAVRFEEPLLSGAFGAQWTVDSGDTHPITGVVRFDVAAPTPTPTPVPAPTPSPTAEPVTSPDAAEPVAVNPSPTPPATPTPSGRGEEQEPDESVAGVAPNEGADGGAGLRGATEGEALDRLGENDTGLIENLRTVARWAIFVGAVGAIGAAVFLVFLHRRPGPGRRAVGVMLRSSGVILAVAALLDVGLRAALLGGELQAAWRTDLLADALGARSAIGTALRVVSGGAAVVVASRLVDLQPRAVSAGAMAVPADPDRRIRTGLAVALSAGILASFPLMGHAAVNTPRWLVVPSTVAHVLAAAIWVGGLGALVVALLGTARGARRTTFDAVVPRYSAAAGWALAVVTVAGLALAVAELESVSELWDRSYGRWLMGKLALVIGAVGLGAYSRFRILGATKGDQRADSMPRSQRFTRVATLEVVVFVAILAVTAVMIGRV